MSLLSRLFKKKEQINDHMKYLVIGLGNIGAEYDGTRHNIGFDILDALAKVKVASLNKASMYFTPK